MATSRTWRTLSAFKPFARRWTPVTLGNGRPSAVTPKLCLTTWNIDAFSPRPVSRAKLILDRILEGPKSPDIIFLQEVTTEVRAFLLRDGRVRSDFLVTDAEDEKSFEKVPFATMTLLSRARFTESQEGKNGKEGGEKSTTGCVFRVALPSKYGRDGLCVDIVTSTAPKTVFCLINVHLDSLWDTLPYRTQQMKILADILREPGCGGGIIAGDFNAISREDDELVDKNGLMDAWVALHGDQAAGPTWGVGMELRKGPSPGRLDKVAMVGSKPEEIEVLRPGLIEIPRPGVESAEILWSDHCGLKCVFTI